MQEIKRTKRYKCKAGRIIMKTTLVLVVGFTMWLLIKPICESQQKMHEKWQNKAKNNIQEVDV